MVASRALIRDLEQLLAADISKCVPMGDGPRIGTCRLLLSDGRAAFVKILHRGAAAGCHADVPQARGGGPAGTDQSADPSAAGQFGAEARGLRWLAEAGAVPVARLLASASWAVVTEWLPPEPASETAAERFGRGLARLHAAGAEGFGSPWPGFIAGLTLGDARADSWPEWYAAERLVPFARLAASRGTLTASDLALVEAAAQQAGALAGPPEPPSRIHGDCWSGNVVWSRGGGVLVDPAAQGGHRETDLAMLELFGAPYLADIRAAYQEVAPLAPGWQARVPLHQLHPLLVHVCLFGDAYTASAVAAARAVLVM